MYVKTRNDFIRDGIEYSDLYKKSDSIIAPIDELIEARKAIKNQVDIIDNNIATLLDFYGNEMINIMPEKIDILWNLIFSSLESMSDKNKCEARIKFNEIYGG